MITPVIQILFPHQLFEEAYDLDNRHSILLIEEWLFFKQYPFHKQKIAFHRASMQCFAKNLRDAGFSVVYIDACQDISDIRNCVQYLAENQVNKIICFDPEDNWLQKRLEDSCEKHGLSIEMKDSPSFINHKQEIIDYFKKQKKYFQTSFYIDQRKKRNVLIEKDQPIGGKWSFDQENRLKYPAKKIPPAINFEAYDTDYQAAFLYVEQNFKHHFGQLNPKLLYPKDHASARIWLDLFLDQRLWEFGPYEDAIVEKERFLHHSVLSPLINTGLLSPEYVISRTLDYFEKNPDLPLSSVEGFVRQIMGWREYIRALYVLEGTKARNQNYWQFSKKIPSAFWEGRTGIDPIDQCINKINDSAYAHHIERLMILGNFMLLCEFDPKEVYEWFMTVFIDAYDWVMVPNVFGMSQFADAGLLATKPYISGSNYLRKMGDFKQGSWQGIWDALYWRFINKYRSFFLKNPRLSMMVHLYDKMPEEKKQEIETLSTHFLTEMK